MYFCSFSGSNWRNLCDIETNNSRLQHNVIFFLTFGLNFPMLKKNISKNVYYQISILTIYLQLLLIKENLCNNPNFILKFGYWWPKLWKMLLPYSKEANTLFGNQSMEAMVPSLFSSETLRVIFYRFHTLLHSIFL